MEINEHRRKHIDSEAFALVGSLKVYAPPPPKPQPKNDDEQKVSITLSNVRHVVEISGNARRQLVDGKYIHLDEESGVKFQKIVSTLLSDKNLAKTISRDFIVKRGWNWLVNTKTKGKAETTFTDYILNEMERSLQTSKYHFPIVFLNIQTPFEIGGVEIGRFTKTFFDDYAKLWNKPDEENIYEKILPHNYGGKSYAAIKVPTIEIEKASEIAFEKCLLAVDILKICSPTLENPDFIIPFDIDKVSRYNAAEQVIQPEDMQKGLIMSLKNSVHPFGLDAKEFEFMKKRNLETFSSFVNSVGENSTELQALILKAIKRLAKAYSNTNHHERIAELISILESLLLMSENDLIKDSVVRYLSRLVTKDVVSRKNISDLIGRMQKVRSKWVHHSKELSFDPNDLTSFQVWVHNLLIVLIEKTKTHTEKETIFKEIDDAIWAAY